MSFQHGLQITLGSTHSSMKRKSRAAPQKCGNHGVCEISAPVQQWAAGGELRARRNEHLTLENTILRRRSTSAFSHNQDPNPTSRASALCDAAIALALCQP